MNVSEIDFMKVEFIKKEMIKRIKHLPLPVEFSICEADADYGYRVNKDFSVVSIGEYSNKDVSCLEDLSIVDLANLIFWNDDECKKFRERHGL